MTWVASSIDSTTDSQTTFVSIATGFTIIIELATFFILLRLARATAAKTILTVTFSVATT